MTKPDSDKLLWWVIPNTLAGMPMPFIHPERRMNGGGKLEDFADDLLTLHSAGIRAVVSLLNLPNDESVYREAGFTFLCLPIPDGGAPTLEQASEFIRFIETKQANDQAVAVHCEAGLGRTGTMLAVFLISLGQTAAEAIRRVREVEKSAVETERQIQFLENLAIELAGSRQLSGQQLGELADRLASINYPAEIARLKSALTRGFYGQ
jgi:atypical dual specificity phosphatase